MQFHISKFSLLQDNAINVFNLKISCRLIGSQHLRQVEYRDDKIDYTKSVL